MSLNKFISGFSDHMTHFRGERVLGPYLNVMPTAGQT